jgi:hypothetical protein
LDLCRFDPYQPRQIIMWNIERTVKKGKYLYGICKEHPKASRFGYVLLHRLLAENKLGRLLEPNEIVHHKDHDGHNNEDDNLEVLDKVEHVRLHRKEQPRRMSNLICSFCGLAFVRPYNLAFNYPKKNHFCSKKCRFDFIRH